MKIEDIMEETEDALQIDETRLDKESLETPKIYGRLLRLRTQEAYTLMKLKWQLKQLYQDKRDYYLGRASPEVYKANPFDLKILKSEVDTYVNADAEIGDVSLKIDMQQEKVKYLEDALKQVANRGFQIKNAIDYQRMMNGG